MHPLPRPSRAAATTLLAVALVASLPGCVVGRNVSGTVLQAGGEATIAGEVVAIDTAPWAYDGNATVQVATRAHGIVVIHLPARWNLCAAAPVDVEALDVGDEVRATGTVGADGELVVCARPTHVVRETG